MEDQNLHYCHNDEQRANYQALRQMGFHVSMVSIGGTAHLWDEGFTVEVPLSLKEGNHSFPEQVMRCIHKAGAEAGKRELREAFKKLIDV